MVIFIRLKLWKGFIFLTKISLNGFRSLYKTSCLKFLTFFCFILNPFAGKVGVPRQLVVTKDPSSIPYEVAKAGLNLPLGIVTFLAILCCLKGNQTADSGFSGDWTTIVVLVLDICLTLPKMLCPK